MVFQHLVAVLADVDTGLMGSEFSPILNQTEFYFLLFLFSVSFKSLFILNFLYHDLAEPTEGNAPG